MPIHDAVPHSKARKARYTFEQNQPFYINTICHKVRGSNTGKLVNCQTSNTTVLSLLADIGSRSAENAAGKI